MDQQVTIEDTSIIVVDDNPLILNVLKSLFSSISYTVYTASNGEEALQLLNSKVIDVIICDVMMPEMDGYDLHEKIRENADLSHIPFVFLTALSEAEEQLQGKEAGADDYIVKPFEPTELLAVVKGKVKRSKDLKKLSEQRYDAYRKRVIHTLSHEFRTPLVAINTGTELLIEQEGKLDMPKVNNLLQAIQRGGQRLERLVSDFMLLQQIEAGIAKRLYEARSKVVNVKTVIQKFVEAKKIELAEEGFTLTDRSTCPDLWVRMYEPQIQDILQRFISNSSKFSANDKSIDVHIFPLGDEVAVEVRDRGIGLDEEKVKEAIDVFGQIDRETLEQQGGGLGLAIANRYAAIHSGRLEFENRQGGGSVVRVVLPVCPIIEDAVEAP